MRDTLRVRDQVKGAAAREGGGWVVSLACGGVTPSAATRPATSLTRPPRMNEAASKTGHLTFRISAGLTVPPWFMGRLRTYNKKGRGRRGCNSGAAQRAPPGPSCRRGGEAQATPPQGSRPSWIFLKSTRK